MATPQGLDEAVERLDRLVDLSVISNTLAATSGQLLARAVAAPPSPAPVPVPVPPARPSGAAAGPPPGAPPVPPPGTPPSPAPAGGPAPAPAPTPDPAEKKKKVGPWGRVWKGLKKRTGISGLMSSIKRGRRLGKATGVAGGARAGAVAGGVVGGVGLLVTAFSRLKGAADQLADQQIATVHRLAQVSGSMAAIEAEMEVRDVERDIRRGEATAGSAKELADARSDRKDAESEFDAKLDNLLNPWAARWENFREGLFKIGSELLSATDSIDDRVREIVGKMEAGGPDPVGLAALEADVRREADRVEAAGRRMMDMARAEASAPAGAARPGMLP
ncbi:MAG: hypothetical protein C0501_09845 [Isosphaera sp.]|nr:hypothetical protein [Isosphaera sp.]